MFKRISAYYSICLFFFLFIGNVSKAQLAEPSYCKQMEGIASAEMHAHGKKQMKEFYRKTASEFLDVVYHRCVWNVDPAVRAISGTVTTYFIPNRNLSQVVFDLDDTMVVDKVMRNGLELAFTRPDNTVFINLESDIKAGLLDSVTIYYHGVPPNTGFGSFTRTTHAGVPVLWTLSEPYGARDWWPCKNTLDDKFDLIDVFITCPAAYKGISNGLRQSEILSDDSSSVTIHWKHRYPMVSYLAAIAVSNYTEFNDSVVLGQKTLPMQTFCYPEGLEIFKKGTQATLDAMRFFHNNFGDYPFIKEKYGHTQFSWGGGEEHQTNSFMANAGESLCAHELAHQWFGNKITCGSWEDIWLNEGFASHLASIFIESRYPESIYSNRKSLIDNITNAIGGSVKVDDTLNVGRIFDNRLSYFKGSYLLYMLRFKMGDKLFFKAVRAYLQDTNIIYGFAKTKDLKRYLEQESGLKLDSFFRQWYEGQGYPTYNVEWSQIGARTVKIKMNQKTSHPSVSFFELPVALKFKNADRDTIIVVDNQYNGETFISNIGFIADSVMIDPEYWLVTKNNTTTKVVEMDSVSRNLVVYPNPFLNQFSIQVKNFIGNSIDIALYNMRGQEIFKQHYDLYNGREFITISVPYLSSGKYILRIIDETNKASTISLLKQ